VENALSLPQEREQNSRNPVSRELLLQYLSGLTDFPRLSEADRERFIQTAISCQLNPYKREIHVKILTEGGLVKAQPITGYEVYLRKAENTGLIDGWRAWTEGTGDSLKAIVEIRRKDWANPFRHEVYWVEAVQKDESGKITGFWERMPRLQLKKVAISQGFRLCFANDIGGMPYELAELPDNGTMNNVAVAPPTHQAINSSLPAKKEQADSVVNLVSSIHALTMENKDILSNTHLEWIENQLRLEKTEPQLQGLLKHVRETINAGGDKEGKPNKQPRNRSYPLTTRRPKIPLPKSNPLATQGTPIF